MQLTPGQSLLGSIISHNDSFFSLSIKDFLQISIGGFTSGSKIGKEGSRALFVQASDFMSFKCWPLLGGKFVQGNRVNLHSGHLILNNEAMYI